MTGLPADSPALPIQQAIWRRLTGDSVLMELVSGVFDDLPEDAAHPYVVIGEMFETPDNVHGGFGRQTAATLHVWTRARGTTPGHTIARRIIDLLDHQPLEVDGHHLVEVAYEFSQTLRDPNPDLRHVPIRFRITTQQL